MLVLLACKNRAGDVSAARDESASGGGRQSAGMLTLLGVPELIASDREDYLAIASRLVDDAQWRHDLSERICAAQDCLFDRSEPVTHLHHWLQETEGRPT